MSWADDSFGGLNAGPASRDDEARPGENPEGRGSYTYNDRGDGTGGDWSYDNGGGSWAQNAANRIGEAINPGLGRLRMAAGNPDYSQNTGIGNMLGTIGRALAAGGAPTKAQHDEFGKGLIEGFMSLADVSPMSGLVRMAMAAGVPAEASPPPDSPLWREAGPPVAGRPFQPGQAVRPDLRVGDETLDSASLFQQLSGVGPVGTAGGVPVSNGPLLQALLQRIGYG